MKFYFSFLFSWMIMHEILFFWMIIFDTNVCTIFFVKRFYKWWFFQWAFQRWCFKKIYTIFLKEKICTKDIFNNCQMFQNLCIKEHFSMISPNVYSKIWTKWFSLFFSSKIYTKVSFSFYPTSFQCGIRCSL